MFFHKKARNNLQSPTYSNIFLNLLKKLLFAVAPGFMFSLVRSFSKVSFSSRERFSGI